MPQVILDLTDEQIRLMEEHAVRNLPPGQSTDVKSYLEFIVRSTTTNLRREKIQAVIDQMAPEEIEAAIEEYKAKHSQ